MYMYKNELYCMKVYESYWTQFLQESDLEWVEYPRESLYFSNFVGIFESYFIHKKDFKIKWCITTSEEGSVMYCCRVNCGGFFLDNPSSEDVFSIIQVPDHVMKSAIRSMIERFLKFDIREM